MVSLAVRKGMRDGRAVEHLATRKITSSAKPVPKSATRQAAARTSINKEAAAAKKKRIITHLPEKDSQL